MLEKTGVPTPEDLDSVFPSEERLSKGPVAVIECFQEIPCNPCYTACKRDAIQKFEDINDLPKMNSDNCNGCTLCVSKCPGLAIMVIDATYSEDLALMKIPYEFLPLPKAGDIVGGLDREGNYVCDVRVVKVQNTKALDKTPVITFEVPKEYIKKIRNIEV